MTSSRGEVPRTSRRNVDGERRVINAELQVCASVLARHAAFFQTDM